MGGRKERVTLPLTLKEVINTTLEPILILIAKSWLWNPKC